jgi:hypothetical protein
MGQRDGIYYDRNATSITNNYAAATIAPHGATNRWTYTVPSGRKAFLEFAEVQVIMETVPTVTATQSAQSYLQVTTAAGSTKLIMLAMLYGATVVQGSRDTVALGGSMELQPAEVLIGTTVNSFTAGSCWHFLTTKLSEFDS